MGFKLDEYVKLPEWFQLVKCNEINKPLYVFTYSGYCWHELLIINLRHYLFKNMANFDLFIFKKIVYGNLSGVKEAYG